MESARAAGAIHIVVVVGANAGRVTRALKAVHGVECVLNERWETGLASSLSTGIRAVLGDATIDGAMIMLTDQPMVDAQALRSLMDKFREGYRVVASAYEGIAGAPIVVGKELLGEVACLEGDAGAGQWLRSRHNVATVEVPAAGIDIDLPADVEKLGTGSLIGTTRIAGIH